MDPWAKRARELSEESLSWRMNALTVTLNDRWYYGER